MAHEKILKNASFDVGRVGPGQGWTQHPNAERHETLSTHLSTKPRLIQRARVISKTHPSEMIRCIRCKSAENAFEALAVIPASADPSVVGDFNFSGMNKG